MIISLMRACHMKKFSKKLKKYHKILLFFILVSVSSMLTSGCLSMQLSEIRTDITELKKELETANQQNKELNEKIRQLHKELDELEESVQAGHIDIQEIMTEIAAIKEKLGLEITRSIKPRAEEKKIDKPETAEDYYKKAYEKYKLKKYNQAVEEFKDFMEKFPESGFVDVAQFWLGECYYEQGDWAKALEEYMKVIRLYPFGSEVPDAYLKLGLCYLEQNNKAKALENFQVVVDIFPHSKAAPLAKEKIRQLKQ
jgi:tol-pal system protein YbgF